MRRALRLGLYAAVLTVGAAACSRSAAVPDQDASPGASGTRTNAETTATASSTAPAAEAAARAAVQTPTTAPGPGPDPDPDPDPVAIVIRPEGLDPPFIELVRSIDGVERLVVIQAGQVRLTASVDRRGEPVDRPPDGFVIQLEARSYDDPAAIEPFAPRLAAALSALGSDELVLSQASATLRRLDVGGAIEFDNGARFRVAAVLPDADVGTAEVVLVGPGALEAAGAGSGVRRAALVEFAGTGPELEATLLAANGGVGVRVFGGRGGDPERDRQRSTLSQIEVKQTFGEFAFRPSGSAIEIDPAWVEANIVTVDLPLLGSTRCHRVFAEALGTMLQSLVDDDLGELIDRQAFQGCWNPRTIAGSARLSKHAWGIAADINFGNPTDDQPGSPVHPEVLARMERAGFVSGHRWTTPDPGHFEYRRPPASPGG